MKFYWLPLLIFGTHLSALNSNALAFEPKTVNQIQTEVSAPVTSSLDELSPRKDWEGPWVEPDNISIASDKGFHRRRSGNGRFRPGRFRGDIFFRNGSVHRTRFRQGEFRRDGIFFRSGSLRDNNFPNVRFRHDGFRRHNFRHDRFRDDRFYRIRIH
ncbi:hypothetical protein [Leptolyngbya sp. Heron Island J]|uniref:hypothetical protein n=1 Tax=Leptolyngbya sp. Heron Island J TaxID=1385935 RepID=UPI0012678CBA|nr:hypothetical protein [Leptolyngbya sp. Heron Island J]